MTVAALVLYAAALVAICGVVGMAELRCAPRKCASWETGLP
jgi:hypothetical protein